MMRILIFVLLTCGSALRSTGFEIIAEQEEVPERGLVVRYRVVNGREAFAFIPPANWQVEKDDSGRKLVFRSENLQSSFTLRFDADALPVNVKKLETRVREKWSKATLDEAGECHARDRSGPALEFSYQSASAVTYRTRVGLLDYGSVAVEVTLTAPEELFAKSHFAWTAVMNSLARVPFKTAAAQIGSFQP